MAAHFTFSDHNGLNKVEVTHDASGVTFTFSFSDEEFQKWNDCCTLFLPPGTLRFNMTRLDDPCLIKALFNSHDKEVLLFIVTGGGYSKTDLLGGPVPCSNFEHVVRRFTELATPAQPTMPANAASTSSSVA